MTSAPGQQGELGTSVRGLTRSQRKPHVLGHPGDTGRLTATAQWNGVVPDQRQGRSLDDVIALVGVSNQRQMGHAESRYTGKLFDYERDDL